MPSQILPSNTFTTAKWIVSATASDGTHTTIGAALTSASSGDTIFIRPGTYTENLTLKAGVNLTAFSGDGSTPTVIISGNCTLSAAGTVSIGNIRLQTNSANLLTVSGSAASIVNLVDCYINCSNNTGISFSSSSASAQIMCLRCQGNLATTGIALFSHSSAGALSLNYCNFSNTGASTTANTISAGSLTTFGTSIMNPITSSGTATFGLELSDFSTVAQNVTALTNNGSGNGTFFLCRFQSGTASAISTSQLLTCSVSEIGSSNTNAITGGGSITYSNLSFTGSSKTINVTTQSGGIASGSTNTAPSAGYIGERITNTVTAQAPSNNTPTTLFSLSLTPGVWDISAIGSFSYSGASTISLINISTTTNTVTGTSGDAYAQFNQSNVAGFDVTLSVPAFRVVLTTTTSYFCVVQANYSTGAPSINARMSAVREA